MVSPLRSKTFSQIRVWGLNPQDLASAVILAAATITGIYCLLIYDLVQLERQVDALVQVRVAAP